MTQLQNNTNLSSINIHLNSAFATESFATNHKKFQLPRIINAPERSHVLIGLSDFNMPYSFFLFQDGKNNTFTIETNSGTSNIIIPEGNYADTKFIRVLNAILALEKDTLGCLIKSFIDFTVNKIYFVSDILKTITFKNITCFKILGFNNETTVFNATNFYCPNCYQFEGNSNIYFRLVNSGLGNINSKNIEGIMESIEASVYPSEIIFYKPNEVNYYKIADNLANVEVQILDEDYANINLNGSSFKFTLTVHFARDKEDLPEKKIQKLQTKMDKISQNLAKNGE
jgi:hypothetical protein